LGRKFIFDPAGSWYADHDESKSLIIKHFIIGLDCWITGQKGIKSNMKQFFKAVVDFLRREWFLLIAVAAIVVIIILFELL
jgi:hypothetical protein